MERPHHARPSGPLDRPDSARGPARTTVGASATLGDGALFAEAEKKLNVDDPDTGYLTVRQPSTTFDTPAGMAVYLSNAHNESGYVEADTKGRVTQVMPADG